MSLKVAFPDDTFNGPLDLLLHLIQRDEIDINDIPIARLTASYLEELEKMEFVNVDEGADFLDLASRLLEIKSRMLLPPEELPEGDGEEDDDFDPRAGLVEALLEYRRFKDAARLLGDMADEQSRRYPRHAPRLLFAFVEEAVPENDCLALLGAFQSMLERMLPTDETADVISSTEVSISTRIEQIQAVLNDVSGTRFSLLLSGTPNRGEMVGFFVAVLELIRRGLITARQSDDYSDIVIERREAPPEGTSGPGPGRSVPPPLFPACGRDPAGARRTPARKAAPVFPIPVRPRGRAVRRRRVPAAFPAAATRRRK